MRAICCQIKAHQADQTHRIENFKRIWVFSQTSESAQRVSAKAHRESASKIKKRGIADAHNPLLRKYEVLPEIFSSGHQRLDAMPHAPTLLPADSTASDAFSGGADIPTRKRPERPLRPLQSGRPTGRRAGRRRVRTGNVLIGVRAEAGARHGGRSTRRGAKAGCSRARGTPTL